MKHPDQAPFAHGCGEPARAELDLDAIEARAAAATEGPWEHNGYSRIFSIPKFEALPDGMPDYPQGPRPIHRKENPAKAFDEEDQAWWDQHESAYKAEPDIACVPAIAGDTAMHNHAADLDFIAHARTDVPALIAELRAARTMLDDFLTDDAEEKAMTHAWTHNELAAVKAILAGTEPDAEVMAHSEVARKVLALRESQRELLARAKETEHE